MAVLSEITELLRRWDVWKRIEEAPDRLDAVEGRLAALEAKLARCPGEACLRCGELAVRVVEIRRAKGFAANFDGKERVIRCEACGFEDTRTVLPGKE